MRRKGSDLCASFQFFKRCFDRQKLLSNHSLLPRNFEVLLNLLLSRLRISLAKLHLAAAFKKSELIKLSETKRDAALGGSNDLNQHYYYRDK